MEFQSSSNNTSLRTRLGSSITLDCHFALAPGFLLSSLEWRRQHRGSGRSLFQYHVGNAGPTVQPKFHVDVEQLLRNGDASLTLQEATVDDEGMYICLVSTAQHQVQHNIQLLVAGKEGTERSPCCFQYSLSQPACSWMPFVFPAQFLTQSIPCLFPSRAPKSSCVPNRGVIQERRNHYSDLQHCWLLPPGHLGELDTEES